MKDVFLCHASEDKAKVVRPLATLLEAYGITFWLDEAEIMWGDSLVRKVNEGLRSSRYAIVFLSEFLLRKNWPQAELESALNLEISSGNVKVLPLFVGDERAVRNIIQAYPLLLSKKYLLWSDGPESTVRELKRRLGHSSAPPIPAKSTQWVSIPMPKIKKVFNDFERSKFVKRTFNTIREYFEQALNQLEQHDKRINTDLTEVNDLKFAASAFVDGEMQRQCVIWLGSLSGASQICYREDRNLDIQNDHSMNDWVTVESDDYELFLTPGGMGFQPTEHHLTPEKAAEYLWRRFTQYLQ